MKQYSLQHPNTFKDLLRKYVKLASKISIPEGVIYKPSPCDQEIESAVPVLCDTVDQWITQHPWTGESQPKEKSSSLNKINSCYDAIHHRWR